jgi:hypothetical protein
MAGFRLVEICGTHLSARLNVIFFSSVTPELLQLLISSYE